MLSTSHVESLLGDGFTLVLSAVGDKELGSALLPDLHRYSFRARLMQSLRSELSDWLCIAGTKIGRVVFTLEGTLSSKLSLVNRVSPALENLR